MSRHNSVFRDFDRNSWIALCLLAFMMILGGASRADVASTMFVRLMAIATGAFFLIAARREFSDISMPEVVMFGLAGTMLLQLIPLPPFFWQALPGHGILTEGSEAAGISPVWRPISMSPDRTLNALFACVPPIAALMVFMRINVRSLRALMLVPLLVFLVSGVVGFLQILSGGSGGLYFYKVTNLGSAVGFFSNRNHQALALVLTLPLLAVVSALFSRDQVRFKFVSQVAAIGSVFVIPMVIITGSRMGLALLAISFPLALFMGWKGYGGERMKNSSMLLRILVPIAVVSLLLAIAYVAANSRSSGLTRLYDNDLATDPRFSLIPQYADLIRTYFPFGAGFGSFDQVFKIEEPLSYLNFNYLNHAHNDLLEMLIEGGLFSVVLLVAGFGWIVRRSLGVWRSDANTPTHSIAKAATVVLLLMGLASVTDYPLRTPAMAVFFALCCALLARWDERSPSAGSGSGRGRQRSRD